MFSYRTALVLGVLLAVGTVMPALGADGNGKTTTVEGQTSIKAAAPVYVPLDSWVYPALERLAALGYIKDAPSDFGPWTRSECKRQVEEASDAIARQERSGSPKSDYQEAVRLLPQLEAEFAEERRGTMARIESLYARGTEIAGTPLTDSYHFGQTISNDFGRPYDSGFNAIAGISGYATAGRFSAYFRGEYQQAPGRPANSPQVQDFIAAADSNPVQAPTPVAATRRFQPLEMYVGAQLGFENITVGQQALWWGPGADSAFAFSDNAAPFDMIRFQQRNPLTLPGPLKRLGKARTEFLFGELSGHHWPPHPLVNAQKIAIDLPGDIEFGFTRSAFFAGAGHPLSLGSFANSLFSTSSTGTTFAYGDPGDPGDRHSGFDFRWYVPKLQHRVMVYSDSYADDDPNPIDNPKRSAWGPGIYISRVPGLPHLDLRAETYSSWMYREDEGGQFMYYNGEYHDSYTNAGNLLGSWIGRDSRAYVGSSTYWFSAKSRVQAQYRQIKAASGFLPGGGTQTDFGVTGQWSPRPEWLISAQLQGERYYIPLLGSPRQDVVASLGVTFYPTDWIWRR
ncbi:MAG: capsule assembly Wzi family protein [Acidobacteriaceae bacterium]|nr:capsule assembly Wzi family protein [Acidobacteriaceae bacterium]